MRNVCLNACEWGDLFAEAGMAGEATHLEAFNQLRSRLCALPTDGGRGDETEEEEAE